MVFDSQLVTFEDSHHQALDLTGATIFVDGQDYEGVRIAATILAEDVGRVTRGQSLDVRLFPAEFPLGARDVASAIIIGCIETSCLLKRLKDIDKVDFSCIRGKWECFATYVVDSILFGTQFGCRRALVIAGSDKRGAIYGAYTLSEQIGVSP